MHKVLLSSLVLLTATLLHAGGLPDAPYIYVEGTASREVPADMVRIYVGFVECNKVEVDASNALNERMESFFTQLKTLGVAESDISAESVEVSIRRGGTDRTEFQCFEVKRQAGIIIRDVSQYGKIVQALFKLPVDGIEFESVDTANRDVITKELEEAARQDARRQAESITASYGTEVIGVYAISPRSIPDLDRGWPFASMTYRGPVGAAGSMKFILPPVRISSEAHVIFLIKDKTKPLPTTNP